MLYTVGILGKGYKDRLDLCVSLSKLLQSKGICTRIEQLKAPVSWNDDVIPFSYFEEIGHRARSASIKYDYTAPECILCTDCVFQGFIDGELTDAHKSMIPVNIISKLYDLIMFFDDTDDCAITHIEKEFKVLTTKHIDVECDAQIIINAFKEMEDVYDNGF